MSVNRNAIIFFFIGLMFFTFKENISYAEDVMDYMQTKGSQNYIFARSYLPQETKELAPLTYDLEEETKEISERKQTFAEYLFPKLHPYIYTDCNYNSNIYKIQTRKKDDIGNTTLAGTRFFIGKPGSDHTTMFQADGGMESTYYHYSGFNRQNPHAYVDAATGKGKIRFRFSHYFDKDFTETSNLVDNMPGFTNYYRNYTFAGADARYNRLGFNISYSRTEYDFADPFKVTNNSQDSGMNLKCFYRPFSFVKTNLLSEFEYGKVEYTKATNTDGNYSYKLVWLGAVGKMTKKVSGFIKLGCESIDYAKGKDMFTFPTAKAEITYKYSKRTNFILQYARMGIRSSVSSRGSYRGNYASLTFQHKFTPKFATELYGYALDRNWHNTKSTDTGYGWSGNLTYTHARWIKIRLEYKHDLLNTRASRLNGYVDNIYSLKTDIEF